MAIEWRPPPGLKWTGRLLMVLAWRAAVPTIMLEQGRGDGFDVIGRDAGSESIWLSSLLGWERTVETLDRHDVKMTDEIREFAKSARD